METVRYRKYQKVIWLIVRFHLDRNSQMQLLYGKDLLAAGWDTSQTPDTLTNFSVTEHNIATFQKAYSALADHINLRCCGC